ncbi:ninein isoform X1 [Aquila chrysaetos chrysaetos]|uniref:Ninein n=1 Tax=Aquila chrysaetos chrysaetos TaxID=223781 RepID=A0A663E0C8_AQUCH|nr:ninein isoform X1 [Aquila chrysaetos chrysaetos]XP_029858256.1 ninein isoform X1 [Aquila chrysaetos chrysaetos]XP_029858265.1 ninein isoform X1 [Aquila chrysaetos chrysaetos]XP_029858273.1 ninein isoform X1 [Aquila chrysaetos chrysaetos]
MDEAEQDQYEARLKELFDSFDSTGTGSLGQEELTDLCHVLHLEEVAPALQQTLLQGNLLGRVHFDQFKEALILILSRTLSNEEHFQEPDSSPEAQPKYIKGGKRYGRRSLPEFQESVEDFAEVTVIEPLSEEACPPRIASSGCEERWKTRDSEEYEAEGQLRFWNPDDLNASPSVSLPTPDWIEEKLQEVCEHLGITRDGHLNRKKLVSICEQYGLQTAAGEVLEEVLHNLEQDGTMSVEDFFYGLFKNGKSLTPSASTPYRQLKRHLSMQSFDESGRRTTTPSAMPSTIGFCLFSSLDDGMGYGCVEGILDCWHQEGIENSQEILKALDFSLDGKVNLTELTLALENELLITKNGVHQAALASFKTEIRHLLERVDQVAREKEKLRSDLEKAEKLKSLMASEVDDHHAAIERRNEYNLRKLDEEYKERIAALKNELRREREQILQQANKQRLELEQEIEKLKTDENYIRDRLALSLKENSRLESELLETGEKLVEYESLASKLQRNLENVLAEKFGDLDPSSAEFFLQEERLAQMRSEYERQCRELQDQIDELHSELEEYRAQGKVLRPSLKNSLSEEFDIDMKSHGNSGIEPDQGLGSEDCNPLNMSIEAEMAIEQMKEQHHRDLHHLKQELEDTVSHYEKQLDETKIHCEKEQEGMRKKYTEEMHVMEKEITGLKNQITELQGEAAALREQQGKLDCKYNDEKNKLQMRFDEEKANLQELLRQEHEEDVRARLEQVNEKFSQEREELIQNGVWVEEKMRVLVQTLQEEKGELERGFREQLKRMAEVHALEKEELQQELLRKHQQDLEEERKKMESDYNRRASHAETQFSVDTQTLVNKYEEKIQNLEGRYQRELHELAEQQREEKSQWEFEKDEIAQEVAEAHEQLKESLANEKAVSSALTQEKDLLEKNFKEEVNKLVCEREQLQKELRDLRNAAEKQEKKLNDKITQLQNDHKKELKNKDERISVVEENGELVRQKLERLDSEYKQEKEDLNSKLLALESLNKDICVRAETEKAEMSLEISNLQGKIQKLQWETHSFSTLQNHYRVLENEYAKAKSKIASFSGMAPLGDDAAVLLNLQKVHEQAVKENVRMAAEIVRLQRRLQAAERDPARPPSPGCSDSGSERSQLPDEIDPIFEGLPWDGTDADKGADSNVPPLLEADSTDLEEMTEIDSDLEKACVKARAGGHALEVQVCRTQGSKAALESDGNRDCDKNQELLSRVPLLQKKRGLEKTLERVPRPKMLHDDVKQQKVRLPNHRITPQNKGFVSDALKLQVELEKAEELREASLQLDHAPGSTNGDLKSVIAQLWKRVKELEDRSMAQAELLSLQEEIQVENEDLKCEMIKLVEKNKVLEDNLQKLRSLHGKLEESKLASIKLRGENTQLLQKVKEWEDVQEQDAQGNAEAHRDKLRLRCQLGKLEERAAAFTGQQGKRAQSDGTVKEVSAEKRELQEPNRKPKEKAAALVSPNDVHFHEEREERNTVMHGLQSTCAELQQKVDLLRCEAEKLREENAILKNEVTLLNEEGSASSLKLRELNGSREEMWQKIEAVRKEKVAVQKMVDNLKKQVADLKTRNQQLDSENTELSQRNSKNQADVQDLNQQLAKVLKQKEREVGKCTLEEWEKERLVLKEELENSKVKSSNMVSSLEVELSKMKVQAHILEQENHILKQELEKTKPLPRCPDLSDLQNEVSSLVTKNEKLQKEKEALSEELNRCIDKVAKVSCLENAIGSLKQEQKSWEQQSQTLKTQLTVSQEKVQSLDETLQNTNLQMSRLKSDLRVTQQEKETLKQEVMSLHKQLQNANEKNRVLERAVPSSGLQDQHRQLHWDELDQLTQQEQQLLRQENERLQREVQSTKTDLAHSREKIRQLESTILSLKHQKHQSQSGIVKAIEQEKLSLKRECEQLQKELSSANRKISQMNSLERELETSSENEGLRKKQVKLDDQLMEMLHSSASVMRSQPPHSRELQQQGCAMVPKEQFLQLQHQLLQAERRSQRLQEELESRPSETNMQQGGHEQLLKMMEERMMDVEQKLRLVKRLLQDKVNQLKEQLSKNTKADAMVKDLYVENAQLLKALEMTEQRQKTAERKNYLLEEKIANLNRIVKNLASPSFNSASEIRS